MPKTHKAHIEKYGRVSKNIEDATTPKGKAVADAKTKLLVRFLDKGPGWENFTPAKKGVRILKKTPMKKQSAPDGLTKKANGATQKARITTPTKVGLKVMSAKL